MLRFVDNVDGHILGSGFWMLVFGFLVLKE
jgi:hypothetical protein